MAPALAWLVALVPAAMLAWFALEIALGLSGKASAAPTGEAATFVVIVPAHDEAAGIAATLARLGETTDPARVLVVADNCTDDTAAIARQAGAMVAERADPGLRGKGYALDHARTALADAPPLAVVVLDADCAFTRGDPATIAASALAQACAVQAENVQHAPPGSAPAVRIGAFAFFVMNVIRARGLQRIGGSALLQGTGMALPWSVFADLPLASGDTVEDIALSLHLARAGVAVKLEPRAAVASLSPRAGGNLDQRRRWEFGFLRTSARHALPLLGTGLQRGERMLAAIGAHLLVPPLALLYLVAALALALCTAATMAGAAPAGPPIVLAAAWALSLLAVALAWFVRGRSIVSFATLAAAPLYVAWKVPMYLGLRRGAGGGWQRAERPGASAPRSDT